MDSSYCRIEKLRIVNVPSKGPARPGHPMDEAIDLQPLREGVFGARTHPRWANMVGPYGGITAAVLMQALMRDPRRLGDPVALTVNYPAAVADGDYEVHLKPARTTRSTQHWTLSVEQGGEVMNTATAMTALRREGWSDTEATMPAVPRPHELSADTAFSPVKWKGNYDMRFAAGPFPSFAGEAVPERDSTTMLWLRDEPPRPLDFPALAAMCDIFYPRIFRRWGRFVPTGTVTFTCYFHADSPGLAAVGSSHVLCKAVGQQYGLGYSDQAGLLWAADGRLLATTHQVMYFRG